jgi:hypothetical protein
VGGGIEELFFIFLFVFGETGLHIRGGVDVIIMRQHVFWGSAPIYSVNSHG